MKYYETLLEKGCFSRKELIEIVGTAGAANSVIYEYQTKGLVEKVKRDFFVVISLETKQPILSRYQIASNLFPDACITHHSAFEVYGYGNQVFYECFVATDKRFSDFEYDGVVYRRVERKQGLDVVQQGNIRITSIEQTVVDSIRDFEKIAGELDCSDLSDEAYVDINHEGHTGTFIGMCCQDQSTGENENRCFADFKSFEYKKL